MGSWNGSALQSEFSETLGDTSTAFKARVLKWMNDIQDDIASRYQWRFLRRTGKKLLTAGEEYQSLETATPSSAPSIATQVGGSLTDGSTYTVAVTYYQSSDGYETQASSYPTALTCSGTSLELAVTGIPTSSDPLVTARRVYVSKDSGSFYYHSTISNNTTTTTTISSNTTVTTEPPDYVGIREIIADPWIETYGTQLEYRPEADLRLFNPQTFQTGSPQFYAMTGQTQVLLYPAPSSAVSMRFNYTKIPSRIFAETTSQPDLPIWMKDVLEAGVLWKGYQYRERSLAVSYAQLYEQKITQAISAKADNRVGAYRVRDVNGNTDGDVY